MRLLTSGPFYGLPDGRAGLIAADPPWRFQGYTDDPGDRAPDYETMSLDEIKALPVADIARDPCWLMLWTSGSFLDISRDAMRAWGFRFSTVLFTWVKLKRGLASVRDGGESPWHRGLGKTSRKNTEIVLLGKIGSPRVLHKPDELIVEAVREHSRKPEGFYERAEAFCHGPRVELFARQKRKGWLAWGNQVDHFGGEDATRSDLD